MKKTFSLLTLAIIAFAVLFYIVYLNHLRSVYAVIPAEVYRSAQLDRDAIESTVKSNGIRSIINLRGKHLDNKWYRDEVEVSKSLGVLHHDISLSSEGLPRKNSVRRLANLLQTAVRPVLVHCKAGADRAGLASIIALLIQGTMTLEEIAKHVSLRYLVVKDNSIGKLFFKQYSSWLLKNNIPHTREQFLKWLDEEYVDSQGNFYYYIDAINEVVWKNGTKYDDGFSFTVDREKNNFLTIGGWVFDDERKSPVRKVEVLLDSRPLANVRYGLSRYDVAKAFNNSRLAHTGWSLKESLSGFLDGCYDLALGIERLDGTRWVTPPEARVCLK
jgi:undecaprenyl-diphosphatase